MSEKRKTPISAKTIEATGESAADRISSKTLAFIGHVSELATAHQDISTKNGKADRVKRPTEFIQLQQTFMTEAMNSPLPASRFNHVSKASA